MTRASLKNPYAVVAISLIVVILGVVSYQKMVVDIFPEINVPVVAVATFYKGMGPSEMEGAITLRLEQLYLQASYVEHIESILRPLGLDQPEPESKPEAIPKEPQSQPECPPGAAVMNTMPATEPRPPGAVSLKRPTNPSWLRSSLLPEFCAIDRSRPPAMVGNPEAGLSTIPAPAPSIVPGQ